MLCVQNDGCDDLEQRKVYLVVPDADAVEAGHVRVVDESGEDYLYPVHFFVPVEFASEIAAQWRGTA